MCSPNTEYQYINPTTQVALFSQCIGNCSSLIRIQWNIYQGLLNSSTDIVKWSQMNQMHLFNDRRFFGEKNLDNFRNEYDVFFQD